MGAAAQTKVSVWILTNRPALMKVSFRVRNNVKQFVFVLLSPCITVCHKCPLVVFPGKTCYTTLSPNVKKATTLPSLPPRKLNDETTYPDPYFSSDAWAAAIAPAIPPRIPGIPCKLFTPHVSWVLVYLVRNGCVKKKWNTWIVTLDFRRSLGSGFPPREETDGRVSGWPCLWLNSGTAAGNWAKWIMGILDFCGDIARQHLHLLTKKIIEF